MQVKLTDDQKKRVMAYKRVFATNDGQIVLDDLRIYCGQDRSSVDQTPDALKTMFNEGKRSVFLRIDSELKREVKE